MATQDHAIREVRALTGLRGIAALTVFFAHTRETLLNRGLSIHVSTLAERLFLSGGRQVDIFFVLSGFILSLTYAHWFERSLQSEAYFKFLRRRFARIYPLHFVMLLLIISFVMAAQVTNAPVVNGADRFTWSSLPATFLMVHAWGFVGPQAGPWNPPSWSVSIEMAAYLLFPLILWGTRSLRTRGAWFLILGSVICGYVLNALTPWGLAGFPGLARGLSEFFLGCMIANVNASPVAAWMRTTTGSVLAAAALVLCFAFEPDVSFSIAVCTAPLLWTLYGRNPISAVLGWQPIYFLGEISYSIYLGHFLFTSVSYRLVSVEWMKSSSWALATGCVGITLFVLVLSTISYYAIERPGRQLLGGRRKARAAAAVAQPS